jgi:hypothetical protein
MGSWDSEKNFHIPLDIREKIIMLVVNWHHKSLQRMA